MYFGENGLGIKDKFYVDLSKEQEYRDKIKEKREYEIIYNKLEN